MEQLNRLLNLVIMLSWPLPMLLLVKQDKLSKLVLIVLIPLVLQLLGLLVLVLDHDLKRQKNLLRKQNKPLDQLVLINHFVKERKWLGGGSRVRDSNYW